MATQTSTPARITKKQVPLLYSWIAPTHDILAFFVESKARDRAIELAAIDEGERILEVAVGTGLSFQYVLQKNTTGHNTGIDLTPAMLKKAKKRAQRIIRRHKLPINQYSLEIGDAYELGFPDAHFDLVLNSYMFDLLPEDHFVPVLREFLRVLKPGGRLIQMNMTHGKNWYNHLWEGLYRIHPTLLGGCRCISTLEAMQQAGFVNVHREYISQWTFPSEVIRSERSITYTP
ncbi:MAG: class I SAM-dependent methyltransferase [Rhodothermaceae bacterium]|nr:class I SAM-dependent methyltransferase [Rhodothermaceae bacterium]